MVERLCPIAAQPINILALVTSETTWTYGECDKILHNLCHHLQSKGITSGSRVAFVAHATPSTIFLLFALFRLQAIACPLSFREPAATINTLAKTLHATLLDPALLPIDTSAPVVLFSTVNERAQATCLFTSGSSGAPKIACHTLSNHLSNAAGVRESLGLDRSTRWQLSLPLFHVGGLGILFRVFLHGGSVVLNAEKPTHLSMVPTQLYRMLLQDNLPQLSCLLLGGAAIPSALVHKALNRGLPLYTTYGMTEMSSIITLATCPQSGHVGKPLPYRELSLSSDGEILVRGETLFIGYDREPLQQDWFSTKDLGTFNEDGNLEILGRKDRLFISGGENIQPEEIERALCAIPGIIAAIVRPVPDPEFGHRPIAYVLDTTEKHSLTSIREALSTMLPAFKHPIQLLPYIKQGDK